jgi:hypothetical protein
MLEKTNVGGGSSTGLKPAPRLGDTHIGIELSPIGRNAQMLIPVKQMDGVEEVRLYFGNVRPLTPGCRRYMADIG